MYYMAYNDLKGHDSYFMNPINLIVNIIIGAIVAFIVKYILEVLGVPAPFPMLVAALAFLATVFGGSRYINL